MCPPFNPALITLSSQCSYSCLFPLLFSSHPITENVHPPLTRTHSFTWLLNTNLFKNKYTRIRTHLLVMPRGPQLLAVVLKTHAAREKGQRSMLAVDSYYSPILSFSQDQWVRWLSENKKREKDRLRKREREREWEWGRDTHHTHLSQSDRQTLHHKALTFQLMIQERSPLSHIESLGCLQTKNVIYF